MGLVLQSGDYTHNPDSECNGDFSPVWHNCCGFPVVGSRAKAYSYVHEHEGTQPRSRALDRAAGDGPRCSVPSFYSDETGLLCAYYMRLRVVQDSAAVLRFEIILLHRFGYPNDEALAGTRYQSWG